MTLECSTKSALAPSTSVSTFTSAPNRRASCGTVCSSNSSCLLQKRKPVNPLQASVRTLVPRTLSNSVTKQRVLSAKLIKLRTIQSQLNDANFHVTELSRENRALKTLQNRQDKALRNYEGTNADLPRLIKSHEDETRVLQEKNKTLRKLTKELAEQIKVKDEEINNLSDQLKHLMALSKDKHLEERQKLSEKLEEVTQRLKEHEQQVTVLNRKLLLETKNCRFKLNAEVGKHKICQRELGQALMEIGRLNGILEGKNKSLGNGLCSQSSHQLQQRRKHSIHTATTLTHQSSGATSQSTSDLSTTTFNNHQHIVTGAGTDSLSLAPIKSAMKPYVPEQQPNVMASPAENIRARLSSGSGSSADKGKEDGSGEGNGRSRPSSVKLDQLMNKTLDLENQSGAKLMESLNYHKTDFKSIQSGTNSILQSLKDADILDQKLRKSNRFSDTDITKKDRDIANQLWKMEYSDHKTKENGKKAPAKASDNVAAKETAKRLAKYDFSDILTEDIDEDLKLRAQVNSNMEAHRNAIFDGSFDRSKSLVTSEEKTKLLATLRAIDNGDSIDTVVGKHLIGNSSDKLDKIDIKTHTSDNLMKELFGDT